MSQIIFFKYPPIDKISLLCFLILISTCTLYKIGFTQARKCPPPSPALGICLNTRTCLGSILPPSPSSLAGKNVDFGSAVALLHVSTSLASASAFEAFASLRLETVESLFSLIEVPAALSEALLKFEAQTALPRDILEFEVQSALPMDILSFSLLAVRSVEPFCSSIPLFFESAWL